MPRNLSSAVLSAIAQKTLTLAIFAKLAFADNTLYLWSGIGTLIPNAPLNVTSTVRASGVVTVNVGPGRLPFGLGASVFLAGESDTSFNGGPFAVTTITAIHFGGLIIAYQVSWNQAGPDASSSGGLLSTTTPLQDTLFPYSQTFVGLGWLAKLSGIPQTMAVQAQNITLSLSGIPASLVSEAIGQVRVTGTATLWMGFFDTNGNLLEDPIQLFTGALDVPSINDGGDTSTISITCENSLLSLNLAPGRHFDDPDQQLNFPGDLGMSFVGKLQNLQLFWPAPVIAGSPYPVSAAVTPAAVDIGVAGTAVISVTVTYSDGSTYTVPSGSGSGPHFAVAIATSNPKVATFDYGSGAVTGRSPGECSVMARMPYPLGFAAGPAGQWRQVCSIFVHN